MLIQYYGPENNFFDLAFFGPLGPSGAALDVSILSATATEFIVQQPDSGMITSLTGTGISYSGGMLSGGTITSISFSVGGHIVAEFSGFSWPILDFADALDAIGSGDVSLMATLLELQPVTFDASLAGEDSDFTFLDGMHNADMTLIGSDYDDFLLGGTNNDNIQGGDGNDILQGGDGNDFFDGGNGTDRADYRNATSGVEASLVTGTASDGSGGTDTFINIENLTGSSFDDILTGDDGDNGLVGKGGADSIYGGGGDDYIEGGAGNDTLDGGAGDRDLVDYSGEDGTLGVVVDLGAGTATDTFGDTDTLLNIERVRGTDQADILLGDAQNNELIGHGGNDLINGGRGNDVMEGGDGEDMFIDTGILLSSGGGGGDSNGLGLGHLKGRGVGHDIHSDDGTPGHDKHHEQATFEADDDTYTGGTGADTFVFDFNNGQDIITDFEAGPGAGDVIDLSAWGLASMAELLALADDQGSTGDVVLTLNEYSSVTLTGVQIADLNVDGFFLG